MLTYLAAIATAVSIAICPTPVKEKASARAVARTEIRAPQLVRIAAELRVNGPAEPDKKLLLLGKDAQRAMTRALFASVKILA